MPTRRRPCTGGPWGTGFLLLGLAVTAVGLGYLTAGPEDLSPALNELSQVVPAWVWGVVWIGVGLFTMIGALRPPQSITLILPMVAIFLAWSGAHAAFWLIHGVADGEWTRAWSSAFGWGMLAAVVASLGRCVNPPERSR